MAIPALAPAVAAVQLLIANSTAMVIAVSMEAKNEATIFANVLGKIVAQSLNSKAFL